jgi:anti-sigma factor RsiW
VDRERARELLSDYLEGELEPALREEFEAHLASCAETREELEALRGTLEALGTLQPVQPPDNFLQQVKAKLRRRTKSPFDFSFGLDRKIPFEAVSMVLIGILIALYLLLVALPRDRVETDLGTGPRLIKPDAGVPPDGGPATPPASSPPLGPRPGAPSK